MKLDANFLKSMLALALSATVSACAYNPFISNNKTTGSATSTALGAGIGGLTGGALESANLSPFPQHGGMTILGGVLGGAAGYYASTLRSAAAGVIDAGGHVYVVGDYLGIYLPTDKIFEPNTADFTIHAEAILASAADVLKRKPENNITISGNTSGFTFPEFEKELSLKRAKKVAASLWRHGVSDFKGHSIQLRKLRYTGEGDFFPISSNITNKGIRQNSRMQITSYPSQADLHVAGRKSIENNIGALHDQTIPLDSKDICAMDKGFCDYRA